LARFGGQHLQSQHREAEEENHKLEATLGHIWRICSKKKKIENSNNNKMSFPAD
jgi:hypothetical protein